MKAYTKFKKKEVEVTNPHSHPKNVCYSEYKSKIIVTLAPW